MVVPGESHIQHFIIKKNNNMKVREDLCRTNIKNPLNNNEIDSLINPCDTFQEKFGVWLLLDTGLRLS